MEDFKILYNSPQRTYLHPTKQDTTTYKIQRKKGKKNIKYTEPRKYEHWHNNKTKDHPTIKKENHLVQTQSRKSDLKKVPNFPERQQTPNDDKSSIQLWMNSASTLLSFWLGVCWIEVRIPWIEVPTPEDHLPIRFSKPDLRSLAMASTSFLPLGFRE